MIDAVLVSISVLSSLAFASADSLLLLLLSVVVVGIRLTNVADALDEEEGDADAGIERSGRKRQDDQMI